MRVNSESNFRVRLYQFDWSIYGTASFNLTGFERSVEPILKECGR